MENLITIKTTTTKTFVAIGDPFPGPKNRKITNIDSYVVDIEKH